VTVVNQLKLKSLMKMVPEIQASLNTDVGIMKLIRETLTSSLCTSQLLIRLRPYLKLSCLQLIFQKVVEVVKDFDSNVLISMSSQPVLTNLTDLLNLERPPNSMLKTYGASNVTIFTSEFLKKRIKIVLKSIQRSLRKDTLNLLADLDINSK